MKKGKSACDESRSDTPKPPANWDEALVCMWRFSKSNGITEGYHRKMKLIQKRAGRPPAYGFKNFENYRLEVIAECG